jgi:hypothetical protein
MRRLPDWFPLPIYKQQLTKEEWFEEIALRAAVQSVAYNQEAGLVAAKPLDRTFREIFVTRACRTSASLAQGAQKHFWPVREPLPFELYFLVENQRLPEHALAEEWAKRLRADPKRSLGEFIISGAKDKVSALERNVDKALPPDEYMDVMGKRVPLIIDLDHDDETLELAFQVWLAGMRAHIGETARQPIGEKEMKKWSKFGLLPAFDLSFWGHITDTRFTDAFIARSIWSDGTEENFVDLTERYRKVTKPMVEAVFHWNFVQRFWRQMELEKSLDLLVASDQKAAGQNTVERRRRRKSPQQ